MGLQNTALDTTDVLSQAAADFGSDIFLSQYFDYSILNKYLVSSAVKNLATRIFNATQENIYINDRDINMIPLCAKLYGSVNIDTVTFFKESNNLHGDDLFLIPKGREIKYYV